MFGFTAIAHANNSVVTVNDPAISSGYQPSYYVSTMDTLQETHIIGTYESRSDHSGGYHPTGNAYVHVSGSASTPVNLVLSSYEPTEWFLDGAGLSFVQSVLVSSCPIPCDHVPIRSWPLFRARDLLRGVIEAFQHEKSQ